MVWWQRLLFSVLLGVVNFVGVLVWTVLTITYSPSRGNYVTYVIGAVLGAYFLVLIAHRVFKSCRETCSVVATTTGLLFGDAVFVLVGSVVNPWLRAHDLNNLRGMTMVLSVPIVIIILSTFWRSSRALRIGWTETAVAVWLAFSVSLALRLWEFPEGEYSSSATLRFTASWFLASTFPFVVALVVALWRNQIQTTKRL
jgi:uncharacterized membrane protein YeaQ/YmgE (transglycosylase-associated protein family)